MKAEFRKQPIFKLLTIGDALLIGLLLLINIVFFSTLQRYLHPGSEVIIEVAGKEIRRLPLITDGEYSISGQIGKTIVRIRNRSVQIVSSPCPHHLCMQTGAIRHAGEMLVCLPNAVVIRISSRDPGDWNLITQ